MPLMTTASTDLFYTLRGNHGVPLLCLHGAGGQHRHWGLLQRAFAETHTVITLDLPGHGRSTAPGATTIAAYLQSTLALLDAIGVSQAVWVGHSMGAAIALQAALDAPQRVAGLGLLGASARMRVGEPFLEGWATQPEATVRMVVEWCYPPGTPAEQLEQAVTDYRQTEPRVFRGDFLACHQFDVRDRLAAIQTPTALLVGELDRMTPLKAAEFLQQSIGGASLTVVPQAGHMLMIERPELVAATLHQLVERITPAT